MPLIRTCLVCAAASVLAACSSTPSPLVSKGQRVGAEQSAAVMQTLPPPAGNRQYDAGVVPDNQEKGLRVGSVVTTTGGQKAQEKQNAGERTTSP